MCSFKHLLPVLLRGVLLGLVLPLGGMVCPGFAELGYGDGGGATFAPVGPRLTRGPYVQLVAPHSLVLRWRTDVAVNSVVRYGTNATNLQETLEVPALTTEHSVTLNNLTPDTKYFYSLGTATGVLVEGPDYHAFTAPLQGSHRPTRIWVVGDSGHVSSGATAVRNAYLNYAGTRRTDAVLMLGDNAAPNGTDGEMQTWIFSMHPQLLRTTPFWPALGNHDTAQSSSPPTNLPHFVNWTLPASGEAGGHPSGTPKYYSFNFANIHFICLDSMSSSRSLSGSMMNWLRADLASNKLEWVIAYWHHPPYSRGASNSDLSTECTQMREAAVRVLEDNGADLVLGGHSHAYERSFLIDGHYGASSTFVSTMKVDGGDGREGSGGPYYKLGGPAPHQGTVYAVVGCSSDTDGGSLNHPAMVTSLNMLGSLVLDIDGGRMEARFLDSSGTVRDSFVIVKSFPDHVVITSQPQSLFVEAGTNATFTVGAISANPLSYQWRKNGVPIPAATNALLTVTNVQESDEGTYDVVVTDRAGPVVSGTARLALRIYPVVVQPPVDVTVVQGGRVTLSIETVGTLPMGYRWRQGGSTVTNQVLFSHQCFYTIENAQPQHAGYYTVALTNPAFYTPGVLSPRALVTVLPDTDGDGLPDDWELSHGLDPMAAEDATLDADGDGIANREEYVAGTDPHDADSHLKLKQIALNHGVNLEFLAASNTTYTVQYKDDFNDAAWSKLADVVASKTNRTAVVTDRVGGAHRFYRLLTPRQP